MNHSDSEDSTCSGRSSKKNSMPVFNPRISRFKNVGGSLEKPAELFRKDLISAMKLADSECLFPDDYMLISDPWRQDWEKGVQVPVNPEMELSCRVNVVEENEWMYGSYGFKIEQCKQSMHELQEEVCRYDLDHLDEVWLNKYNAIRDQCGQDELPGWLMEKIMEELETRCYLSLKAVEAANMEYDEDTVCDVCRMPDVEEGNEMVFCDGCDVGVHQACYGILKIPKGSWVCRTCEVGIKPRCELCTTVGGAMKGTKIGNQWAHISCAIWIPEVTIGDAEKMEPICNIDLVPANRWNLICCVCKERSGVCVKCCDRRCKSAFHVTCAFKKNFKMKISCEDAELQFRACCDQHSKDGSPKKASMTEEQKKAEKSRLQSLREDFYLHADYHEVAQDMGLDRDTVSFVYEYWKLKRKCNFDKPLLTPKMEETAMLVKQKEDGLVARLKMFIHIRQDLERVRNLCYMVSKRERTKNQLLFSKKDLFLMQVEESEKFKSECQESETLRQIYDRTPPADENHDAVLQSPSIYDSVKIDEHDHDGDFKESSFLTEFLRSNDTTTQVTPLKTPKPKVKNTVETPTSISIDQPASATKSKKRFSSSEPRENPYARPTYKSFAWLLGTRKRRKLDNSAKGDEENQARQTLNASSSDPVCNLNVRVNGLNVIATRSVGHLHQSQSFRSDGDEIASPMETGERVNSTEDLRSSAEKSSRSTEETSSDVKQTTQNCSNGSPTPLQPSPEIISSIEFSETPVMHKNKIKKNNIIAITSPRPQNTPPNKRGRPRKSVVNVNKKADVYDLDDLEKLTPTNQDQPPPESPKSVIIVDKSDALSPPQSSSSPNDNLTNHLQAPIDDLVDKSSEGDKIDVVKVVTPRSASRDILCSDSDEMPRQSSGEISPQLFSPLSKPPKRKYTKRSDRPNGSSPTVNGSKIIRKPRSSQIVSSKKSPPNDPGFQSPRPRRSHPLNDSGRRNLIQSTITTSPLFGNKSTSSKSPKIADLETSRSPTKESKPNDSQEKAKKSRPNKMSDDDDGDEFVTPPKFSLSSQENGIVKKRRATRPGKFLDKKGSVAASKSFQSTLDKYLKVRDDLETDNKSESSPEKKSSQDGPATNVEHSVVDATMKRVVLKLDRISSNMEKVSPQKFPPSPSPDKKTLKNTSNLPRRSIHHQPDTSKTEEQRTKYPRRKSINARS